MVVLVVWFNSIGLFNDETFLQSDNISMLNFIVKLLKAIFSIVSKKRKDVIFTLLLLKKERKRDNEAESETKRTKNYFKLLRSTMFVTYYSIIKKSN